MKSIARFAHAAALVLGALAYGHAALAEPPPDVAYQGQLLDAQGVPKQGTVNLQIRIYEALAAFPGETALFVEDHPNVGLDNGIFSIRLGTGTALSSDTHLHDLRRHPVLRPSWFFSDSAGPPSTGVRGRSPRVLRPSGPT